jgi:hypothetical protein
VTVLLGNGNGTFRSAVPLMARFAPRLVVVGDFNRDGNVDLAAANFGSKNVSLFLARLLVRSAVNLVNQDCVLSPHRTALCGRGRIPVQANRSRMTKFFVRLISRTNGASFSSSVYAS